MPTYIYNCKMHTFLLVVRKLQSIRGCFSFAQNSKNLLKINDAIENFMIFCTNQDLTIKTRKSYESTLKLFAKFLEEEHDITAMEYITEEHIHKYLEFTKERGKYSLLSQIVKR